MVYTSPDDDTKISLRIAEGYTLRWPKSVSGNFNFTQGNFNFTRGNFKFTHGNFDLFSAISIYSQQFQFLEQ